MTMPLIELQEYFAGTSKHIFYDTSVKRAEEFCPHADGVYPKELIEERRPNEPLEVKEYRKKVWVPKTKPTFGRIVSSLSKIRRSADWSIGYPELEFTRIAEGEELSEYAEKNYPYFTSITNWVFAVLLKKYLTDPNAVCLVRPINFQVGETDYVQPYPFIFDSCNVVAYEEEEYCLLENKSGCQYWDKEVSRKGKSFYYIDAAVIEKYDQVDKEGGYSLQWSEAHNTGEMPAFKLGAIITETDGKNFLHESRIEAIIPELDEALREYSDLQAGKVLHMHPERWEYTQLECPTCNGTGKLPNPYWVEGQPDSLPCTNKDCHGGRLATGPYSKILIKPSNALEQGNIPTPPAGYVEKDVEILKLMDESVDKHMFAALSAINFQFLDQSPLSQSGIAKEVDKDELNNTVHSIAEDLVRIMDNVYALSAKQRYWNLYSMEEIQTMLPTIPVPERFDILSSNYLGEELDKAKKAGLNPSILNEMELEYTSKKFNADGTVRDRLELILSLDPLSNIIEDNKIAMLGQGGILKETYIISSNIQYFVERALSEDANFADKTWAEQMEKMKEYAAEVNVGKADTIINEVNNAGTPNQPIEAREEAELNELQ